MWDLKKLTEEEIDNNAPFFYKCCRAVNEKISGNYFPPEIKNKMYSKIENKLSENSKILLINDLGFQWVKCLYERKGIKEFYILCVNNSYKTADKFYKFIVANLKFFNMYDIKVIPVYMDEVKEMVKKNGKFDICIANPPYGNHGALGNRIAEEALQNSKEVIFLMPLKSWKTNNIFNYIDDVCMINDKIFDNVDIADLAIAKASLKPNPKTNNWTNNVIFNYIVKDKFSKFYKINYNSHQNNSCFTITFGRDRKDLEYDPKKFFITYWTPNNGIHIDEKSKDIQYNIYHNIVNMSGSNTDSYITFKNPKEVENLCKWWYNEKLPNMLLKNLGQSICTNDTIKMFIPNIDWSQNVEYTDEYVLSQMGLKWNENKDGVETI